MYKVESVGDDPGITHNGRTIAVSWTEDALGCKEIVRRANAYEKLLAACQLAALNHHSPLCATNRAQMCDCHVGAAQDVLDSI